MTTVVGVAIALAAILALGFGLLMRRLVDPAKRRRQQDMDPAWITNFSVARYRPLLRMLDERDYEFLRAQPGFEPALEKRLRTARRQLFRQYLRTMRRDFDRLYDFMKMVLLYSAQDRPDLAANLLKLRVGFHYAMFVAETRLALHTLGLGTVDVSELLGKLEFVHQQVSQLAAAQSAA